MDKKALLNKYIKSIKQYADFIDAEFSDDENRETIEIIEENLEKIKYILNFH